MKTSRLRVASIIADQTLAHGMSSKLSNEIAAYLLTEHRVSELDSLLRDVAADWAAAGVIEVLASSAHPLSDDVQANITQTVRQLYPTAKKIIVTDIHDPEIIGGVRLQIANQQLDLSVEAKLNKFKQLTTAGKD